MKLREYYRVSRKLGLTVRAEVTLLFLLITAALFEGIGIGMLLPIIGFIQNAGDVSALAAESQIWARLIAVFDFAGVPISLATLIATSFVSIVLRQAVAYARQMYNIRLRESLLRNACNQAFSQYLQADTAYHDSEASGEVVNSLTTELRMAVDAALSPIQIVSFSIMTLFYIVLLLILTGPVTVAVMLVLGVVVLILNRLLAKTLKTGRQLAEANKDMAAFLVQRLGSVRLVRLAGTEDAERADMSRLTERQRSSTVNMRTYLARVDIMMEPLSVGIGFVMLYFGVKHFSIGIEEIGIFAVVAMMRLMPTVKEVLRSCQLLLAYLGSLFSFEKRLDAMAAAREHRGGDRQFAGLRESIRFERVGFHYANTNKVPALREVDVSIPAGKMTALVGPSGAGKSTFVDLLPRLRDPSEGLILIDGQPLLEFSVESLRAGISYVSQSPVIFNVTAAQHIRYGKPNATDDEVRDAAVLAGAKTFIDALPEGFDTMLGEDGIRLSGGQRQRLDLARALVRKAPILILDEPTSNLDADAEQHFRDAIARIRETSGITIIVIAHRLSTVSAADQIITLEEGCATGIGRHETLMADGGWYAKAYAQQTVPSGRESTVQTAVG